MRRKYNDTDVYYDELCRCTGNSPSGEIIGVHLAGDEPCGGYVTEGILSPKQRRLRRKAVN